MTDAFWNALFSNLPDVIGAVALGIPACMAAYMTWRNGQRAELAVKKAEVVRTDMAAKLDDVHQQQTQTIYANSGSAPLGKS